MILLVFSNSAYKLFMILLVFSNSAYKILMLLLEFSNSAYKLLMILLVLQIYFFTILYDLNFYPNYITVSATPMKIKVALRPPNFGRNDRKRTKGLKCL